MLTPNNLATVRRLAKEVDALARIVQDENKTSPWMYASKNTAALRRRSMDLTRALADLRSSQR